MINWKVRLHNPAWWLGMAGIVMSPVLAYLGLAYSCLLYTSPSPRDYAASRMPSSA